jgi:hypothetical protein
VTFAEQTSLTGFNEATESQCFFNDLIAGTASKEEDHSMDNETGERGERRR